MSNYTEGPWYVHKSEGCGGKVATTSWGFVIHGVDFCIAGNAEADAHLISAAPELLEALEELLSIGSVFISAIEANDPSVDFENWETKARAAIARARGEAQ